MNTFSEPVIAEGPHSIEAIVVDQVKHLTIARSGDCEHITVWIDSKCFLITAFINSANEPQIRIKQA